MKRRGGIVAPRVLAVESQSLGDRQTFPAICRVLMQGCVGRRTDRGPTMIEQTVERWHQLLAGNLPGGLDELLHDDVVFLSPIVFSPQRGKELTKMYLQAAFVTLAAPTSAPGDVGSVAVESQSTGGGFHYVKEVWSGHHAFLEFETKVGDTFVNGVDIITCDGDGKIVEFKVMIRPLKAINLLHEQMRQMIEQMSA
jgi:hypothetical protein